MYIIFAMECNFSFSGGGVELVVTLQVLLKCHEYFAVSGFNLIRKYINKDVLTDMSNNFFVL